MSTIDHGDEVVRAALEQYAVGMSPEAFGAFIMRVRPPGEVIQLLATSDPADRIRAENSL